MSCGDIWSWLGAWLPAFIEIRWGSMNFIWGLYAFVTALYPPAYQVRFREEMLVVFRDALTDAVDLGSTHAWRLLLRELRDLPGALVRTHMEVIMAEQSFEKPSPWGEVALGVLLFLVSGLRLIRNEIPYDSFGGVFHYHETGMLAFFWNAFWAIDLFIPSIGLCIGYVKAFPRWSYAYLGAVFIGSINMTNVATPGFQLFGYEMFGRQTWGNRAFVPLVVALLIAILVARSLKPFLKLITNAWEDWTVVTYAMFGLSPMLLAISFDEMHLSPYFMAFLTLVMLATAILYLRVTLGWQRAIILFVGVGIIIGTAAIVPIVYWQQNGWINVNMQVRVSIVVLLIFFSPLLLGLLHYLNSTLRTRME